MPVFWKRIVALIIAWTLFVGISEALFFTSLRNGEGLGSEGVDYSVAFSREKFFREHLDDPCPLNNGQPCSPEQRTAWQARIQQQADLYQGYHKQFRSDVVNRSRSFLLVAGLFFVLGCLFILILEFWYRKETIYQRVGLWQVKK